MLRDRIRKWGINTKNKKLSKPASYLGQVSHAMEDFQASHELLPLERLEKPIPSSSECTSQRRLLCKIDHWLDGACTTASRSQDYEAMRFFLDFNRASMLASQENGQTAWRFLRNAGSVIRQVDFAHLPPCGVISVLGSVFGWQWTWNETATSLRLILATLFSGTFGKEHPLTIVMEEALSKQVPEEIGWYMLAIVDSKTAASAMGVDDKENTVFRSREVLTGRLYDLGQHATTEQVLDQWSPIDPDHKAMKLTWLARAKHTQGHYEEADRLYSLAFDSHIEAGLMPYTASRQYADMLLEQSRTAEAADVLLRGLSWYEIAAKSGETPKEDHLFQLQRFEWVIKEMYKDFGKNRELGLVVEKLDALSLDDCA